MLEKNRYLLKNVFSLVLGRIVPRLISFFLIPLCTYTLSADEYGTIDLLSTITSVLTPILILSISDAVLRFALDKGANRENIMSVGLLVLGVGTLSGLVLIPLAACIPIVSNYGLVVYTYTLSCAYMQMFCDYLRGCEKLNAYAAGNIFHTMCVVSLNLIFLIVFNLGVLGYILACIVSNFLTTIYAAIVGRIDKVLTHFRLDTKLFCEMVRYSALLVPHKLMWWVLQSSDRVIIASSISTSANGIYAVACKLPLLLSTFSSAFNQAWIYSAVREKDTADTAKYYNSIYDEMVRALLVMTSGIFLILKPLLFVCAAPEYRTAWKYAPFLLIGFCFLSLAEFMGTFSIVHKDSKTIIKTSAIGAVINVTLNLIAIPTLGEMGAALSTCISYIAIFIYRVYHTKKHYVNINVVKPQHLICFGVLILMGISLFLESIVSWPLLTVLLIINLYLSKDVLVRAFRRAKEI